MSIWKPNVLFNVKWTSAAKGSGGFDNRCLMGLEQLFPHLHSKCGEPESGWEAHLSWLALTFRLSPSLFYGEQHTRPSGVNGALPAQHQDGETETGRSRQRA